MKNNNNIFLKIARVPKKMSYKSVLKKRRLSSTTIEDYPPTKRRKCSDDEKDDEHDQNEQSDEEDETLLPKYLSYSSAILKTLRNKRGKKMSAKEIRDYIIRKGYVDPRQNEKNVLKKIYHSLKDLRNREYSKIKWGKELNHINYMYPKKKSVNKSNYDAMTMDDLINEKRKLKLEYKLNSFKIKIRETSIKRQEIEYELKDMCE